MKKNLSKLQKIIKILKKDVVEYFTANSLSSYIKGEQNEKTTRRNKNNNKIE